MDKKIIEKSVKRSVYIFAFGGFGVYNSKQVNVSDIQHFQGVLKHFRDWNCARKILMPLTFTCFELYSPNANIYIGLLNLRV